MANVKISIDGKQIETEGNRSIIQVARENGISIPHFCWHEKLPTAGNCRICLVDVEKMPKLAIACMTNVADGMVVNTKNERVVKARQAVMEFILINHPLDCPICDEAGECKLQEYSYKFSRGYSRFGETKVHKQKRVQIGPHVMFDAERCIACSRCIRFCDRIAGVHQLQFVNRGDHTTIATFPGETLDNPYSMNVVDICPVGALTNKDFRFKSRVWEMSFTESVCGGCARGCNVDIGVRNNEILRLTPRKNDDVNGTWMCDHGRLETWKHVNAEDRITGPMVRKAGILVDVGWDEAMAKVAGELKLFNKNEIAFFGSAYASNEDNFVLSRFAKEVIGSKNIDRLRHRIEGDEDSILIRADKTPNDTGAEIVGIVPGEGGRDIAGIVQGIRDGHIKALYALEDDIALNPELERVLYKLEFFAVHASNENRSTRVADVVLASSTYAERSGTITNFQKRVQKLRPAIVTLERERAADGLTMSRQDTFTAPNDSWGKGRRCDARASWRIVAAIGNIMGGKFKYSTADEVFADISHTVNAFKGQTYMKIGSKGSVLR